MQSYPIFLFLGISLFKWPNVYDIWNTYLTKFLKRYEGTKLERARDLFEQCLDGCPPQFAKGMYTSFFSNAVLIIEDMCKFAFDAYEWLNKKNAGCPGWMVQGWKSNIYSSGVFEGS